jgi:uncharacterized protein (DUF1697 family)
VDTYILLLRGINVGGRNRLPMADLRALVAGLGHGDVRTHLQSGNVVCTGSGAAPVVADRLSSAIRDELGLSVPVVARTGSEWSALMAAHVFTGDGSTSDGSTGDAADPTGRHVTFLAAPPDRRRVDAFGARAPEFLPDRFAVVGADVFLCIPGRYSETRLQNALVERVLGQVATTRNWRTVTALASLAGLS